jgi:hypothetical protein
MRRRIRLDYAIHTRMVVILSEGITMRGYRVPLGKISVPYPADRMKAWPKRFKLIIMMGTGGSVSENAKSGCLGAPNVLTGSIPHAACMCWRWCAPCVSRFCRKR